MLVGYDALMYLPVDNGRTKTIDDKKIPKNNARVLSRLPFAHKKGKKVIKDNQEAEDNQGAQDSKPPIETEEATTPELRDVIDRLDAFQLDQKLDVNLIISPQTRILYIDASAVTDVKSNTPNPCHVLVKIKAIDDPALAYLDADLLRHNIAHELYHCVQFQELPGRPDDMILVQWISDGPANFFEFFQYPGNPKDDLENCPQDYYPEIPLTKQSYASSLFFISLHNSGWDLKRIDAYVRSHLLRPLGQDDIVDLAQDSVMQDAFGEFAKSFHDKQIFFDSPQLPKKFRVRLQHGIPIMPLKEVNLPAEGATDDHKLADLESWTFKKKKVVLQPGQTVSVTVDWKASGGSAAPRVILYHRLVRTGNKATQWVKWAGSSPEVLIHKGCEKAPITYEFLIVPVAGVKKIEGNLHFVREQKATCACKLPGASVPVKRSPIAGPHLNLQTRQDSGRNSSGNSIISQSAKPTEASPTLRLETPITLTLMTPTPSLVLTDPTPPEGQEGLEDWDSNTSWLDNIPVDTSDPDGDDSNNPSTEPTTDEENCPHSCVLGNWVATPASMELHSQDQYFGYYPTGFLRATAKKPTSYTIRITPNSSAVSESGDYETFIFEEVLTEEITNTEQPSASRKTPRNLKAVSMSNVKGMLISIANRASTAELTFGYLTRKQLSSYGSLHTTTDDGSDNTSPTDGVIWGPRGSYFEFNCTESTLQYIDMTRFNFKYRSYTFTRG
ncbi:hypothetical protein P154DRAFT_623841 [Amniculicola lignicola CBS 123094]|uniref:Uncharacterized protein n=1 Tax=Amniculicola lignicola CBS 123094 TaxID=1392246 RepID=A0A6A5W0Y9_9PLEO|nr:hypothetical protein P154DRAFT_623841 [Amniculicola lignicola CBS 123094]